VLRRREFVPYRSVIREFVLANPLASWSPDGASSQPRISPAAGYSFTARAGLKVMPVPLLLQV
jgi:hypothetical protein